MKDINYQEDDWREAKSALAPFAAANWMGGLFNNLVKVAENMEEAEADIQELDSDGAISFQHTNHTGKYSTIEEDLLVLYKFCCHAGERMENLVNLPFYEKLDAFVGGMQELSISTYATTNRMEVKEQRTVTTGEYAQSFETIKAEVTMEDLLNGDNFYANQMQLQYRDWKRANPDQDVSEADFKMSMIHTRAFEYKSIKNEQEEKEFWVSIVATVGIIAVSVLCPPAGLALSVAYGGLEISSAVSGKDWFSGRELSTGERYTRAGFGVLDVIPGVKAFTTGAKAVGTGSKLLRLGDNVLADSKNIGRLAKGTMGEGLQAGKQAMHLRLSNAQKIANQAGANVQRKLAKDWNDLGAAAKAIQGKAKQAIPLAPRERLALAGAGGSIPEQSAAGASAAATKKKLQEMMQKMDNLNVKGSGKDDIIKGASRAGGKYSTQIDSKVIEVEKASLPDRIKESYTDGYYRTVETLEDVKVYRTFGGNADAGGGFATSSMTKSRIDTKIETALLPEWKNSRMYEAEIIIPKGQQLNIGKVAPQTIESTGTILSGGADQILMPQDWPLEWIYNIKIVSN
ncbi:ribonuclease YeeF family protein [Listeria welshimeri]|nr:ribonuclease YeeF family protein [Listeria welshimeri]